MDELSNTGAAGSLLRALGLGDVFQLVLIAFLAAVSIWVVERGLPPVAARLGTRARAQVLPWVPVFRLLVLVLAAVLIVPILVEPGTESLLGLVGASAVAIGFAFKDYLTSILAGVVVLFERPYRQGDWVQIGDVYGEVRDMGMRAARILTPDDDAVTVPHSQIWTSMIRNANDGAPTLQCAAEFFVHPEHDARVLQRVLGDAALSSPWIDVSKPVAVTVTERPWGTQYRVKAYPIAAADQFRFLTDVTVRGKTILADLGAKPAVAPAAALSGA